ncbi:hypothetical protein H6504_05320 [Candidatus Woesearchaeota archaeon]|nr:hypothetical protein [Candidatus Woesearchaeota archaeon]
MKEESIDMIVQIYAYITMFISGLMIMGAVFMSLASLILRDIFADIFSMLIPPEYQSMFIALGLLLTILLILSNVFNIWVVVKLMQYKNWARIFTVIILGFNIFFMLFGFPGSLPFIALNGALFYFFCCNEEVIKKYEDPNSR